jgi:hypothetical protein
LPEVFLIHNACVELPAVMLIKAGTVAKYVPISVVVKLMANPFGYEFNASMFAVFPYTIVDGCEGPGRTAVIGSSDI